ncbi:MAG: GerMN domain-containing protein [Patescibacteria group bacterium]|nr:GerMN domain-containing protein [Patescibacteria group bacterium]
MSNKLWFILVGILLGFVFGWFVKPVSDITTFPKKSQVYFVKTMSTENELVAVERSVDPLAALATVLVQSILVGPSGAELGQGLTSAISYSAKLNYVRLDGGTAFVDFNNEFDKNIAGSAKVIATQDQINKTLTSLPGIEEVRLTIDFETRPAVLES